MEKKRRQIKNNWKENKLKHILNEISPNEVQGASTKGYYELWKTELRGIQYEQLDSEKIKTQKESNSWEFSRYYKKHMLLLSH